MSNLTVLSSVPNLERSRHEWAEDSSIGRLLVDAGKLSATDIEKIVQMQQREGVRFGEAAVRLGVVSAADVGTALSHQFDYPYISPGESEISEEVVAAHQPFATQVEALRDLRSQISLAWPEGGVRSTRMLAITSAARNEGRSYLAANLAVVFSQLGERTLLVDADMRNPRQHLMFGLPNRIGLSSILSGREDDEASQPVPGFPDLFLLSAGPPPPNPLELLGRRAFSEVLRELSCEYDMVILDTAALECGADAQMVAARSGYSLIVARQDHTRFRALSGLKKSLVRAGVRVVGTALSRY